MRRPTTAAGWPRDFSGAFGREARASLGLLAESDGSLAACPCGCVVVVRGTLRRPRRWGGSRIGGSVGLLLPLRVDDVGAWGLDAALRRANHLRTCARYLLVYRVAAVLLLVLALAGPVTSL